MTVKRQMANKPSDDAQLSSASEETYRTLFNSIDEGFCIVEVLFDEHERPLDYRFLEINASFERQTGIVNGVGRRMREIEPRHEKHWFEIYGKVALTGEGARFESYAHYLGHRWYDVYAFRLGEPHERKVGILFRDIIVRKRAEANLAFLSEVSHDLVRLTNVEDTMNVLGEKIGRFFGVKQCTFVEHADAFETSIVSYGWNAEDVLSLRGNYRLRDFISEDLMVTLLTGEQVIVNDTQSDARVSSERYGALGIRSFIIIPLLRGEEWPFQISIIDNKPREWRDDEIELMRELTTRIWTRLERARAERMLQENQKQLQQLNETLEEKVRKKTAEVRQLASDAITTTLHERQRISSVLHDDLQQRVFALKMQMSFLNDGLPIENDSMRKEASAIEKELAAIVEITRDLSIDLSPPILRGEGLTRAIDWWAARMREQYGLPVEIQANGPFILVDQALHVLVFNCVRELLFNVVKHAEASKAVVALEWLENGLQIEVRDDGKGFAGHNAREKGNRQDVSRSLGLPAIRHQLSMFGGSIEINSGPGAGTQVILVVPISRA